MPMLLNLPCLVLLSLSGLGSLSLPAQADPVATPGAALFDELVELFPDSSVDCGAAILHLHTARGVPVAAHVLITGLDDAASELAFDLHHRDAHAPKARWYRFVDVPVEENTGLVSRTERFDGKENPHVIRRAPFRIFEALRPIESPTSVGASTIALRIEIPIAPDAPTGQFDYELFIGAGSFKSTLRLIVNVHAVAVPLIGRQTLHYTNWFSTQNIAKEHSLEQWSEEYWFMLARYAALMARGRQNTFWLRWPDVFEPGDDGVLRLQRQRLEHYVCTFNDAGLYYIEGAPFAGRPGGDWSTTTLQLRLVDLPATSEAGRAALASMAGQLMEVIESNGWEDRWLQHIADEPTDTNAEDYRKLAAHLRELMPGVPIVEATMSTELAGAVDIWCPQVQEYQRHREFFEERRAHGDRLWVYTCLVPGGPWLNRLLDMERLRQVYIGWAAAKYDLHGFLHWGLNHYKTDPFVQSVVDHPAMPGTNNRLPAGDSHVIYPSEDGPLSSHRFEAHRIGLEDYELLRALRADDSQAADRIIEQVFRAFDDYNTDVDVYREAKRQLLQALSGDDSAGG